MKGVTGKDFAQSHGMPMHPGRRALLPRSRPVEVSRPGAQAHRLRRPRRGRGRGRDVPLPRLRAAHPGRARQPRPPDDRAGVLPGAVLPALPVPVLHAARRGEHPAGRGRRRADHDPVDRPRPRRPVAGLHGLLLRLLRLHHHALSDRASAEPRSTWSWAPCSSLLVLEATRRTLGTALPILALLSSSTRGRAVAAGAPASQGAHLRDPHRPDGVHHRGAVRHPARRRRLLRDPVHHLRRLPREVGRRASSS